MTRNELVTVTQAELDELAAKVGLGAGCSFQQIQQRIQEMAAEDTVLSAAAVAEDRRIIAEAIKDGRLPAARQQFWADALQSDRKGTRALIASMPPRGLPTSSNAATRPADTAADAEMAHAYAKVTGMPLGRSAVSQATPAPSAVQLAQPTADDALYNKVAWKMDPVSARRAGIEPPASAPTYFEDTTALKVIMNSDGTGQWVDPGQADREQSMNRMALEQQRLMAEQAERDTTARAAYRTDRDRMGLI